MDITRAGGHPDADVCAPDAPATRVSVPRDPAEEYNTTDVVTVDAETVVTAAVIPKALHAASFPFPKVTYCIGFPVTENDLESRAAQQFAERPHFGCRKPLHDLHTSTSDVQLEALNRKLPSHNTQIAKSPA